jgi:peptide/nickel transport system ATP-binding protein
MTTAVDEPTQLTGSDGDDDAAVARIEDLAVTFRRGSQPVRALRGVSLEIGRGEVLGLVGESGSGKSVLGLSLLGLLPRDPLPEVAGRAVVCGTDMQRAHPDEVRAVRRRRLGAVFQDPMTSLNPTMRIGQQVVEATGDLDRAVELLKAVGIPDPARRMRSFPHELSGGQRQRVMIAMAVAGSPALVVADEPTTALDVTVQAQVLGLVRTLCDTLGTSFLVVTHDLGVASQVSDRIAVLYAGRLVELGEAPRVLRQAVHPYTHGLLRSRLTLAGERRLPVPSLPGEPPDPRQLPVGCAFAPRCPSRGEHCDEQQPDLREAPAGGLVACWHPVVDPVTLEPPPDVAPARERLAAPPPRDRMGNHPPAVVLSGVAKHFAIGTGRRRRLLQAVAGVDLTVARGESVALVGESGCGKSTLLRIVAGLERADSGVVDLARDTVVQMVFQDAGASLTPWLTVGEQIGERLRAERISASERDRRVREALTLVGLPSEVARAKPATLSGGQRQRVALARAVVVPPDLLLCDEPTSALDVSLAATVLNLIGRLRDQLGMAVLFVTHDLAAARVIAERIAVMYLGRIVEMGSADAVCSNPRHPYTEALLAAVPTFDRSLPDLAGEPADPLAPPSGCAFHPRCPLSRTACRELVPVLAAAGTERAGPGPGTRWLACPVRLASGELVDLEADRGCR